MTVSVTTYETLDALPSSYSSLFDEAAADSFYLSKAWFRTLLATTADNGDRVRIYGIEASGAAKAALIARVPCAEGRMGQIGMLRALVGFSTVYSPLFSVVGPPAADRTAVASALAAALSKERPRWDCIHLKALDPASPAFACLEQSLRARGLIVQPYLGFGNWFEPTAGLSFEEYLARRPAALVNTYRRKEKKLGKRDGVRFCLYRDPAEANEGIVAYERVYANSWKTPEPYPRFMPALIRTAARMGALRLGVVWIGDEPVAAQVWITWQGRSTIFKLAHDQRFDALSVGSVLTMWMMRHALDVDRVSEVDFGVGDDPYKRTWLAHRRERWGLLALSPRTPKGLLGIARHVAGRAAKRALSR
jgi:CelD/BcsL family acetyltransferase involved in cellulose biosynthesis